VVGAPEATMAEVEAPEPALSDEDKAELAKNPLFGLL
jgi:hypothetical protein